MDISTIALSALGAVALGASSLKLSRRLQLSRAKHRSLAGHARMSRRVAAQLPFYDFEGEAFFASDGAAPEIVARRRAGFRRLADLYRVRFAATRELTSEVKPALPDLAFTSRYRAPYPYTRGVSETLSAGSFLASSSGVTLTDLDGNRFYDLTGSYGTNVFGYDFYKACIEEGAARVLDLGPVLGLYHPVVAENVSRLRRISGLDDVTFHMSGTEAVMQAVRLARYHTGRSHVVRFCGAYHGWWDDVQPGLGNPVPADRTYTLADMSEATLKVLRTRRDIACVLVNPLQVLHPNRGAPSDSSLVADRETGIDRASYTTWLIRLREVCTARGIVLVFDEIFVGFRIAKGGAQEYFGVRADLVTYGKTLGGGLPVGIVCGRHDLMRRYREDRPADICFARGTFNAHPYVMGAMAAFLGRIESPEIEALYESGDELWNGRAADLNRRLAERDLPVRIANLSSIWTVNHLAPSRYNWMLQYYLRAEGLALSWVGTGRIIFSHDYRPADFDAVAERFVAAGLAMKADGWWEPGLPSGAAIRRRILREMLAARWPGRRAPAGGAAKPVAAPACEAQRAP